MIDDPTDRRLALDADGVLAEFNRAEVLVAADIHVALRLGDLTGESDADVLLAAALAVRAVRQGSTCLDLTTVAETPLEEDVVLPWPEPTRWLAAVGRSRLLAAHVLRLDEGLLYLDRYWREEVQVRDDLLARLARPEPETDPVLVADGVLRVYPKDGYTEQRAAAAAAAGRWTTVLTGGPGTGKTATVAGLLALLAEQDEAAGGRGLRIALSAPTGKAAARLQESVQAETAGLDAVDRARLGDLRATTLHRMLGSRYPATSVRFRHDRGNRLPHDVVVVDETSMVPLTMMARLLEAVRPDTRLVLVGDPDQLASVEAGAVLKDMVDGLGSRADSPVTALLTSHRFTGDIAALAQALRDNEAGRVVEILHDGEAVELIDPEDAAAMEGFRAMAADRALAVTLAADAGDGPGALAALDRHRLLCAHREGPYGVGGWNRIVERRLADLTGITHYDDWYSGRPVLVTANDHAQGLYNGDMGVTIRDGDRLRVVVPGADGLLELAPTRLPDVQTVYAMTVHKSQGSQAQEVSVVLPPDDSPLLTHELFYTAVTRAQHHVRVVGTEAAVRAAVARRVQRASGLARRLGPT
ncbi:MAG: recD [Nocardioidaceae bacterium]|nr:recD [Nocardioidaceae bacterium]